jgi:hypothetical protein
VVTPFFAAGALLSRLGSLRVAGRSHTTPEQQWHTVPVTHTPATRPQVGTRQADLKRISRNSTRKILREWLTYSRRRYFINHNLSSSTRRDVAFERILGSAYVLSLCALVFDLSPLSDDLPDSALVDYGHLTAGLSWLIASVAWVAWKAQGRLTQPMYYLRLLLTLPLAYLAVLFVSKLAV